MIVWYVRNADNIRASALQFYWRRANRIAGEIGIEPEELACAVDGEGQWVVWLWSAVDQPTVWYVMDDAQFAAGYRLSDLQG